MNSLFSNLRSAFRHGMTLLEITIAVVVFASAMIPILMMSSTTARETVSMERHLVAGQFASGVLDRLLVLPFAECQKAATAMKSPQPVLESEAMKVFLNPGRGEFSEVLRKSFREFLYTVSLDEATGREEKGQMLTLTVTVSWPASPGSKVLRNVSFSAVKYHDNP